MTALSAARLRPPAMTRGETRLWLVSVVAFVLVAADVVVGGLLTSLDTRVRDAIQPRSDSAPWWWEGIAHLGDLRNAIPAVAVLGLVCSQACWRWWPVVLSWTTFAVGEVAILVLKLVVGRPGPGVYADREGYPGYLPSGHTATAALVVALAVFVIANVTVGRRRVLDQVRLARGALAAGLFIGVVAGSRAVLADTHWCTDVVGGLLLTCIVVVPALAWGRAVDHQK